jgi:hypothetical protein
VTPSPKASRFITLAQLEAPGCSTSDALGRFEQRLRDELAQTRDEDAASDLSNDLGFVRSLRQGMRNT